MYFVILSALFTVVLSQSLGFLPTRLLPKPLIVFNNKLILPILGVFFLISSISGSEINSSLNSFHYLLLGSGFVFLLNQNPKNFNNNTYRIIYNLPLLVLIITLIIYLNSLSAFRWLIKEDHLYENLQFLFYLISGLIYLDIFTRFKRYNLSKTKRGIFLVLSACLLFIAFEEISWGQRILGIDTPESLREINSQKELTIHNIRPIQNILHTTYTLTGLAGAFSYKLTRKYSKTIFKKYKKILPPPFLFIYFFATSVFYFFNDYIVYYVSPHADITTLNHWQEVFELFFSGGFFFTALNTKSSYQKASKV